MSYSKQTSNILTEMQSLVCDEVIKDHIKFGKLLNLIEDPDLVQQIKKATHFEGGWLFVGADYNAVEARIDALLTKDSNKLAVYIDGYDSHSFNAFTYWPEKFPDVKQCLDKVSTASKFYKVEYEDGTIGYITNEELENV